MTAKEQRFGIFNDHAGRLFRSSPAPLNSCRVAAWRNAIMKSKGINQHRVSTPIDIRLHL